MISGRQVAIGPILPEDLARLFVWGDDPGIARLNEPYLPKNLDRERDFWLNPGPRSQAMYRLPASNRSTAAPVWDC